ncbi:MAG: tetraacyldisaccharide 4'-kinase [Bacteroidales bacterium]|nr:tetraacyldisaccharide 4'-kinase [Bacteroidales bacterium]
MRSAIQYCWKLLLLPFSWVYGLIVWIRNKLFDLGILPSKAFPFPVISVGNISVGGTGKTPHVEYLIDLLKGETALAVLSRGYRRKSRNFLVAETGSSFETIGDESRQIKQKYPEITVAVDRKRVHGVTMLMEQEPGTEVILLDDAFQHRAVKPGLSILLIDYNRPLQKDRLLPAGRLREPGRNRTRADIILITRTPEDIKPDEMRQIEKDLGLKNRQHLYFTGMKYGELLPVFPSPDSVSPAFVKNKSAPLLVVSGIENPEPLHRFAETISAEIRTLSYPDHHAYGKKDLRQIEKEFLALGSGDAFILTTEKDAMRFQNLALPDRIRQSMVMVRIQVVFLNNDAEQFNKQIISYVRSHKRDSRLHKP